MSAPDELRQLADRLTDLADGGTAASTHSPECWRYHEHCAYLAAAVALRHHANLTDENARLRELCMSIPLFRRAGDS